MIPGLKGLIFWPKLQVIHRPSAQFFPNIYSYILFLLFYYFIILLFFWRGGGGINITLSFKSDNYENQQEIMKTEKSTVLLLFIVKVKKSKRNQTRPYTGLVANHVQGFIPLSPPPPPPPPPLRTLAPFPILHFGVTLISVTFKLMKSTERTQTRP